MQRLIWRLFVLASVLVVIASQAFAQADAEKVYQQAKGAYEAGRFAEAKELAQKASQTDPKNPEVFLLLGRAHYQLGELDEAIAAWKRTLELAPEEPYARQMLEVLRAERAEVEARIRLFEILLGEELYESAWEECKALLADKGLSGTQRARIMALRVELDLRTEHPVEARTTLEQLSVLYPGEMDPVRTALLLGEAKLQSGAPWAAEGIAILEKLVAEHADTPAAATAQLLLITFRLRDHVDSARVDQLAKWIDANPQHRRTRTARQELIGAYLRLTRWLGIPAPDADVSPADTAALALAAGLYEEMVQDAAAERLTKQFLEHFNKHYADHGAHAAAAKATETLAAAPLRPTSRLMVLRALARHKTNLFMRQLGQQSDEGKLPQAVPRGELPQPLVDLLTIYDAIDKECPAQPTWANRVQLAAQLRKYSPIVLPSAEFKGLSGPDAWALDVALPVIKANADAKAVKSAVDLVQAIIQQRVGTAKPKSQELAVGLSTELVESLPPSHSAWPAAMNGHAQLLDQQAKARFARNLTEGRAEENAKPSELQQQLLAALGKHVGHEAAYAPAALELLAAHLEPWIAHDHWAVAEQMYDALAKALPEAQRREAALKVAGLWLQQVARQHERLLATGLTVPRKLDLLHVKALERCYTLQGEVASEPVELKKVRGIVDQVVRHYVSLQYYEVAEEAVGVKPAEPVDPADEYAAFHIARLGDEQARRQLDLLLKEYNGSERIAVGPAFREALEGYQEFIAARPASPLVPQAAERVFAVGRLFESHGAHEVAAVVYRDFATFAAGINVLAVSAPQEPSTAERAAFAAAQATDAQARKLLAQQMAEQPDAEPPQDISDEFSAAVTAYVEFVKDHPDSPLAVTAAGKIMAVGLEYAKVGAWEVADGVFAGLLDSELALRRPERLEFCRALCQLGQAMPDHAREMLTTLTQGGLREQSGQPAEMMLASRVPQAGPVSQTLGTLAGMAGPGAGAPQPAEEPAMPGRPPGGRVAGAASQAALADQPAPSQQEGERAEADRDVQLLAMIRNQEANRAARVAQLRVNNALQYAAVQQQRAAQQAAPAPSLSDAELARQERALRSAYDLLQAIRKTYPTTATAEQARGEILVMVGHWRSLGQWQRAAELARRFLGDNPADAQRPRIRLEIARDWLAWASRPIERKPTRQAMLAEASSRFDRAREELAAMVQEFAKEKTYRQQAQWDAANSFLTQARVVTAFSPTLARGQYVRAARELKRVATEHPDHPQVATIPQTLWGIGQELEGRGYFDEAVLVWNDLMIHCPMEDLAQQAALKIAQTYHQRLQRPLRAAEAYQELNFARGGSDQELQNAIYQIGSQLKGEKRWVEALHVLEMFVDSFPRHQHAGQALTMIGQIHQTNEAWEDAIAAYRRVIDEFENGQWVQDAKWAIAECTINLSRWHEAGEAYRAYVEAYPDDAEKANEAKRRIEVLKDLVRYQALVDEEGQRKAFDAQFQIAAIVKSQLANPVKAIIEYRKLVSGWPESHLADDALYKVGVTYLDLGETEKAREALLGVAEQYPASPLADDALFMVGKSYEDEAGKLASVSRAQSIEQAKDIAQRQAYDLALSNRRMQQQLRGQRVADLKKAGKAKAAEVEEASMAANWAQFNDANVFLFAQKAYQDIEAMTAAQLADRQDKINAALRKAVEAYTKTSKVAGADRADEALLQMATIYDQRLKDSQAAMATWLEIASQFSGTAVAEDASWRIAQTYERQQKYDEAVKAYEAFLRNYRRSPNAGQAQFAIAESYEHLGEWVKAMDSYTNYLNNFPDGPLAEKAKEQINWIKTYRL